MNREDLFNQSIESIYSNYDKLDKSTTKGHVVASILQKASEETGVKASRYSNVFITIVDNTRNHNNKHQMLAGDGEVIKVRNLFGFNLFLKEEDEEARKECDKLINASGYTKEELMMIEHAYSMADGINEEQAVVAGVNAAIDILALIHQSDKNIHEVKAKFQLALI